MPHTPEPQKCGKSQQYHSPTNPQVLPLPSFEQDTKTVRITMLNRNLYMGIKVWFLLCVEYDNILPFLLHSCLHKWLRPTKNERPTFRVYQGTIFMYS